MKLAELYEATDEPRKALNLVYEGMTCNMHLRRDFLILAGNIVIDARKRGVVRDSHAVANPAMAADSLFLEKGKAKPKKAKRGMTIAQLQGLELEHEAMTKKGFEELKTLTPKMKAGDPLAEAAWLIEAEKLIESFREVKPLFPSTRVGHTLIFTLKSFFNPCVD